MSARSTAGSWTSRRTELVALALVIAAACNRASPPPGGWDDRPLVVAGGDHGHGEGERLGQGLGLEEGTFLRRKGSAVAAPRGDAPQVDCGRALPSDVIAKYLPDATPQWGEPFDDGEGGMVTSCRLVDHGLKGGTIVRYKCGAAFSTEAHGELPCVIEVDELGEGQVADRAAFMADLQAALTPNAVR
jgi:hypothetical protein